MTSKQIWNHEVTYHPEDVQDRSRCGNPDIRVYIPDTIQKLDLFEDDYTILEYPDNEPCIIGRKLTEDDEETPDSDSVYKLFTDGSTRLRITIKSDWVDEFIEYDAEDILIVEVNTVDDEFRIYKNDEYDPRKQELKDQGNNPRLGKPVLLTGAMFSQTKYSDKVEKLRKGFGDDIDDEGPATATE
jgi:hypothetical protein